MRAGQGGPRQNRVGKDGGTFQVRKFRTMVVDGEQLLAHLAANNGYRR